MSLLLTILSYVAAVAAGLVVALKFIAPKTKTALDDKILDFIESVLPYLPAADKKVAKVLTVAKEKEKPVSVLSPL